MPVCAPQFSSVQFSYFTVPPRAHPSTGSQSFRKTQSTECGVAVASTHGRRVRAGYAAVLACPSSIWYIVFTHGLLRMTLFVFSLNDDWMMAIPG